jgi:hypothetical protein
MSEKQKLKTIHCLKTRMSDSENWGPTEYFETKRDRDEAERMCRILGGIRTHSFSEKVTPDEREELLY